MSRTATEPETSAPTIGTKAPRKTSAASAGATGTPRMSAHDQHAEAVRAQRHQNGRPYVLTRATASHAAPAIHAIREARGNEVQQETENARGRRR